MHSWRSGAKRTCWLSTIAKADEGAAAELGRFREIETEEEAAFSALLVDKIKRLSPPALPQFQRVKA
jgi:hypothetical protein